MRWAILCAAAMAACSSTTQVEVAGAELRYAFVVIAAQDGGLRTSQVFGVEQGQPVLGALPHLPLYDGDTAYVVSVGEAAMLEAQPGFDRTRARELSLVPGPAPPLPQAVPGQTAAETLVAIHLPQSSAWFAAPVAPGLQAIEPVSAPALVSGLRLQVPVDPEYCRLEAQRPFMRYGASLDLLPDAEQVTGSRDFLRVVRLDEERALALTERALYLIRRGQAHGVTIPRDSMPGDYLPFSAVYDRNGWFTDVVLERLPAADGGQRVALGGVLSPTRTSTGVVWDLSIGPEGMRIVGTATAGNLVDALDTDPQGNQYMLHYGGRVFVRARGSRRVEQLPAPVQAHPDDVGGAAIRWTGDPRFPLVASTNGMLHVYQADARSWQTQSVSKDILSPDETEGLNETFLRFDALVAFRREGELEIWAGGSQGVLMHRRGEGRFERLRLVPPPRFLPCAVIARPYLELPMSRHIDDMVFDGEYLSLTVRSCTAILQVRRSDGCVSMVPVGDVDPAGNLAVDLQALDFSGGELLLAGERGSLYQSLREP